MIHWRETDTGYLAMVTRLRAAAVWSLIGLALAVAGVDFGLGRQLTNFYGIWPAPGAFGWLGPAFALLCLVRALSNLRNRGWVEVAMQGRRARWGSAGDSLEERFVEVLGFQSVGILGPWLRCVVVVLPGGRRIPVLRGYWSSLIGVGRVVSRLNELLGFDRTPGGGT